MNYDFYPSYTRAKEIDQRMKLELANSLGLIVEQISEQAPELNERFSGLTKVIEQLRDNAKVSPLVFTSYYQLTLALCEGEEFQGYLEQLLSLPLLSQSQEMIDLNLESVKSNVAMQSYHFALDTDERLSFKFNPPTQAESKRTRDSIERALSLMKKVDPALHGEFTTIVSQIILAAASKEEGEARFDGASSYMLWGGLALSVDDDKTDLQMLETLAHESAHSFLFGLTMEEPLVWNSDDELYDSPLRQDPRPMDGIYHATYVSARMHYAMSKALVSGLLSTQQEEECLRYMADDVKAFSDGYAVVKQHGRLSTTGQTIMKNALEYMRPHLA